MYKELDLKSLQFNLLQMMQKINEICCQEKIKYFMLGGTFIGAVRHKGFIPWDDDIDIAMDRKNYEKFLSIIEKKLPSNMELVYYNEKETNVHWIKIIDKHFKIVEKMDNIETEQYLFVDIFPFDNVPDSIIKRKIFKLRIYLKGKRLKLAQMLYISEKNNQKFSRKSKEIIVKILKLKILKKYFAIQKVQGQYDKLISKYKNKETKLIANLCVNHNFNNIYREMFEKEKIGSIVEYDFEDTKLKGIENYDYLLRQTFGDYMKLPPKEERISKHFVKLIDLRGEK